MRPAGIPKPRSAPETDVDVVVGYPSQRGSRAPLVLGPGSRLRSGTVLYDGSVIGSGLETGHHVVIREDCVLGDRVSIWSNTVIDYDCRIGDDVKIHTNCYVAQHTEILDGAFLAPGVTIANDLYPGQAESAARMSGPWIGPGAQLGVNVTVLPFVRIGEGCLIGAGSVVTRDIAPGLVAFGNPARVHGRVSDLAAIGPRIRDEAESASRFRLAAGPHPSGPR